MCVQAIIFQFYKHDLRPGHDTCEIVFVFSQFCLNSVEKLLVNSWHFVYMSVYKLCKL